MNSSKSLPALAILLLALVFSGSDCDCDGGDPARLDEYGGPEKIYPPDGGTDISRTPFFNWRPGDIPNTVNRFGIVVKIPGAVTRVVEEQLQDTMYVCPDTLEAETTYEWWVNADTYNDQYITSEKWEFTTGTGYNNPPGRPEIVAPAFGESCPTDVMIRWTCFDPDGDALTYDVWLGHSLGELAPVSEGQSDTEYLASSLEYGTQYWLEIVAHDGQSESVPNENWYFSIIDWTGYHGVYAELIVHRSRYLSETTEPGVYETIRIDHFSARFDSVFAPDGYINPKQPAGVAAYNVGGAYGTPLSWIGAFRWYFYNNPVSGAFLGPGVEYYFDVSAGDGVPALETDPILFPECQMTLVEPLPFTFVPRDGFTLSWTGYDTATDCPARVRIRIQDLSMQEWTGVDFETENDGSYTFTAGDLSALDPMVYQVMIVMSTDNTESIVATGYDPRGFVRAETWSTVMLFLE